MRKSNKQNSLKKRKLNKPANQNISNKNRRGFLASVRNVALALVLVGGAGTYAYSAYMKDVAERDLSKIGKGLPSVVQVHDPNCSVCAALQKNTRSTLSQYKDGSYEFLVANIATTEGREFASFYKVPHVTLLLFNAKGDLKEVLQGMKQEEQLEPYFTKLIK